MGEQNGSGDDVFVVPTLSASDAKLHSVYGNLNEYFDSKKPRADVCRFARELERLLAGCSEELNY
jgi:hypothetical protein